MGTKIPKPITELITIHIPELGPNYKSFDIPIGARNFSEDIHRILHHPNMELTPNKSDHLVGTKIGELTILALVGCIKNPTTNSYNRCYLCRCSCGSIKIVRRSSLMHRKMPTCGCRGVHDSQWQRRQLFTVWTNMLAACYSQKHKLYPNAGALGIQVCEEWKNVSPRTSNTRCKAFLNFERWAYAQGIKEIKSSNASELNLTRIDKTKDFSPDNCVFLSRSDLHRNTHQTHWITAFEHTFPMIVWCEITHLNPSTVLRRLKRGWPPEDAIATPPYKLPIDGYPAPIIPDEYLKYEQLKTEDE